MNGTFSPINDFLAVADGLQPATLIPRDRPHDQVTVQALFRAMTDREAARSNGRYRSEDRTIHVAHSEAASIIPGDMIRDEQGSEWTVLSASLETMTDRWRSVCRNLVVTERLDTLITIQYGIASQGTSGAQELTWRDYKTRVRGCITRIAAVDQETEQSRSLHRAYTLHMREILDMRRNYRVVGADGVVYRVTGYQAPESIDQLASYALERWPG